MGYWGSLGNKDGWRILILIGQWCAVIEGVEVSQTTGTEVKGICMGVSQVESVRRRDGFRAGWLELKGDCKFGENVLP